MERTDRPSRDCLLFQNWMSEERQRKRVEFKWRSDHWCENSNLTVLEGQELKDAVHDGDHNGETQQVRVGF